MSTSPTTEYRWRAYLRLFTKKIFDRLPGKQFLLIASFAIALTSGLVTVLLKTVVHFLQEMILTWSQDYSFILLITPPTGILLTVLTLRVFFKGELQRGTSFVLLAIGRKSSKISTREIGAHTTTTALTVGLGGSAGIEAPIVQAGAAIGSGIALLFPLGYRERTLLLACGSAAGIAAAFNAPIAGVLFALEVLLVDVSISAFIPLLIAGATGALCSNIIMHEKILLSFPQALEFNFRNIPFYLVLGVVCGLMSVFYIRNFVRSQNVLKRFVRSEWFRMAIGCLAIGALVFVLPAYFGEGLTSIKSLSAAKPENLFSGSPLSSFVEGETLTTAILIIVLALLKVFAVSLTLGAGGTGGNFAPALFSGACLGYAFAIIFQLMGWPKIPVMNFCLVGMAGVLAGIFHSPLTAIFLIAEITGGYGLMIPLMAVSAVSTGLSRYLNPTSLDETILNQNMQGFVFDRDMQVLSHLNVKEFIETDFGIVKQGTALREFIQVIAQSKRNVFPVLNDDGGLEGLIMLENIRELMFDNSLYDHVTVDQLMQPPVVKVSPEESMSAIMEKFDKFNVWNIPVESSGRYIGFISKSKIFSGYRHNLKSSDPKRPLPFK